MIFIIRNDFRHLRGRIRISSVVSLLGNVVIELNELNFKQGWDKDFQLPEIIH